MKLSSLLPLLIIGFSSLSISSCEDRISGETVESAYLYPILPTPQYKFSRNGYSSVDFYEISHLDKPIDRIKNYLKQAQMSTPHEYNLVYELFNQGIYDIHPKRYIATSPLHQQNRDEYIQDIENIFENIAKLSGYGTKNPFQTKNTPASEGVGGYVAYGIGYSNRIFVDEKGIDQSELFNRLITGSLYVDKIFNEHLDERIFENENLRSAHEKGILLKGKNYTELEHHWDMAYGYFTKIRPLITFEGIPGLKDIDVKIHDAFARGRHETSRYQHDLALTQMKIVRAELSKAFIAKTMQLLITRNLYANIQEDPKQAFNFITKGYGMIYTLQFIRNADGEIIFKPQETKELMQKLLGENGFWDEERLIADEKTDGSLANIAQIIGNKVNLTIQDFKR